MKLSDQLNKLRFSDFPFRGIQAKFWPFVLLNLSVRDVKINDQYKVVKAFG